MSDSPAPEAPGVPASLPPEEARQIGKHIQGYLKICAVQIVFVVITVAISFANFQSAVTQVLATLLCAGANGALVAGILMHLKEEKRTIWKFLIFTGIFFFVLFFLTYLARTDGIMGSSHTHH